MSHYYSQWLAIRFIGNLPTYKVGLEMTTHIPHTKGKEDHFELKLTGEHVQQIDYYDSPDSWM